MPFSEVFQELNWDSLQEDIYHKTSKDVLLALQKQNRTIEDFKALVSPAAKEYIPQMAALAGNYTKERFGNTVHMYIPMYLSNECQNICTYCGFSYTNDIPRKTLSDSEILREIQVIKNQGYDSILLVTGEANTKVGIDYLEHAVQLIRPFFSSIAIEVQPLDQDEYERLISAGITSVLVYQETYHQAEYKSHHPKGKKSNFFYRLETPDRLGQAGIHKVGVGALLGLEDWRTDALFTALHLQYLEKTYWQTRYSVSFPRLRPAEGLIEPKVVISDKELVQLISAFRLWNQEIELSISTRESIAFRDNCFKFGITHMSAGSKTNPGGYALEETSLEQFETDDIRSSYEVAAMIKESGFEPVWKEWF